MQQPRFPGCPVGLRTGHASRRRMLLGVAAMVGAGVLLVGGATPALAHARLRGSVPAAAATVTGSPATVRLAFTEVVEPGQSQVLVTGPEGRAVAGVRTTRDPRDATVLRAALPPRLPRGTYAVTWRVLSVDGHPVAASFRFAVGAATGSLTATSNSGFGPSLLGGTGRALDDVGLLALVGLLAFPLLVLGVGHRRPPPVPTDAAAAVQRRLRPLLTIALLMAVVGNMLLTVDTLAQSRGFPAARVWRHLPELGTFLGSTRTGQLLAARETGLLLLGGALAMAYTGSRRPAGRATGAHLALGLGLLGTVSLSSHAGTAAADAVLSMAVDWSHLVAAGVWTGGLLALALAGLPVARAAARQDPAAGAEHAAALTARFSDVAQLCMLVVLATGLYEALVHVSGLGQLGRTAWGGELVAKLALWAVVLLVASASTASLVPRISQRAAGATARLAACGELASAARFELAAAAALITVAAALAGTAPPDQLT